MHIVAFCFFVFKWGSVCFKALFILCGLHSKFASCKIVNGLKVPCDGQYSESCRPAAKHIFEIILLRSKL